MYRVTEKEWKKNRKMKSLEMKTRTTNPNIRVSPTRSPKRETEQVASTPRRNAPGMIRNLVFDAPIRTVSEANRSSREPWQVKMRRRKDQQTAMGVMFLNALQGRRVELPCVVRLTRVGPKRMDSDNLAGSFKACRDQIARQIGVDDGDTRITFEYEQTPIGERSYNVIVEIQTRDTTPKPVGAS